MNKCVFDTSKMCKAGAGANLWWECIPDGWRGIREHMFSNRGPHQTYLEFAQNCQMIQIHDSLSQHKVAGMQALAA